ncbi:Tn3 transposase [Photorhabdus aegyptia]|uniref:Tn3 transposase n=1 Tax=Photorhabdus aegyptia TaxID=2805098 RepID=A0A022PQH8_9GAMM|nr:Tn3 transposase [Photorhabdus aegyptia]
MLTYLDDENKRRRTLQQLRREGYPVKDEDVEKLSPLQCGHINMQGRYSFTVPESVSKGELRAFNEEV